MKYGYGRVSTGKDAQKFDRQEDQLIDAGCELIFLERVSGTSKNKPELQRLLSELQDGDELVCVSIDRLGRSTQQVLSLVNKLEEMGVGLTVLKKDFRQTHHREDFFLLSLQHFPNLK